MKTATPISDFLAELRRHVTGEVRDDHYSRLLYSTDASPYQVMPLGVLIPKTMDDVQAAVELAHKYKMPLLPRGGGSSLCGQGVNSALIIDTSRHLDHILEINPEQRWARVQPGVVLDVLNGHAKVHGLQFGPDPASAERATVGGIVSNNSSGAHSVLYGMTADHVLEMTCLLNDGSIAHIKPLDAAQLDWHRQKSGREGDIYRSMSALLSDESNRAAIRYGTPKHWRRSGGYNLARFIRDGSINHVPPYGHIQPPSAFFLGDAICGGEGTLATITELKLALVPRPKKLALVIVEFPNLMASLLATPAMLETQPDAIELVDDMSLRFADNIPEFARLKKTFLQSEAFCFLAVEYTGDSDAELRSKCDGLIAHLAARGASTGPINVIYDPQKQANVWKVRKVGLGLMMSARSDWKPLPFVEDTAVPPEHLAEYIGRIEQYCRDLGVRMTYYAHASAGCLHIRPILNLKHGSEVEKMKLIAEFVCSILGEYGGAMASEHAHGRLRSWLSERFYGKDLYGLFKQVKHTFDPDNLFNPGNLVTVDGPPAGIGDHLRIGPDYKPIEIKTHLHWGEGEGQEPRAKSQELSGQGVESPVMSRDSALSTQHSAPSSPFLMEIEMCNGAGVCRKTTTGAMCPSFIATREEEHATRGRANMLRAASSGLLPKDAMFSPRLYQTMELCVGCKACKAECPSSVDMARIKTEYLAQYYSHNQRPVRDFLFANIDMLARFSSGPLAGLANAMLSASPIKALFERTLGISAKRTLPHFSAKPFLKIKNQESRIKNKEKEGGDQGVEKVVLFADTMNTYVYPHVAAAAAEVLAAMGCEVVLPGVTDAGRPALSKGMIPLARATAKHAIDALYPLAQQGLPIIFIEPSDWSAVTDDYAALLPNDPRLAVVAKQCVLFDDYVNKNWAMLSDKFDPKSRIQTLKSKIVVHTHCHQKALVGGKATIDVLKRLPGVTVTEIDSSCCGMAGTFGYEAEHYDISLKMSEHRLAPTIRELNNDDVVVAAGISCRQQIGHTTDRRALHLAEVLAGGLIG